MNPSHPPTSYIANLNRISDYHREIKQDLTDRGFPCIISNDILETPDSLEYPMCSPSAARSNITNKISTLKNESLNFFLLFIDDSLHNDIASFELGLVVNLKNCFIVLVGPKSRYPIHFIDYPVRIIRVNDYEEFQESQKELIQFPELKKKD